MNSICEIFSVAAAIIWLGILAVPWRPWNTRERLDALSLDQQEDLSDITVLIPARNEAEMLRFTLPALKAQGGGLNIMVIDDRSSDATAQAARRTGGEKLRVISGRPLPPGWTGKLWALEQGRHHVTTPLTLLLDADIELGPGILVRLRRVIQEKGVDMVSLMAALRMQSFWERLLLPAFVFFFKLLYPFRLSNSTSSKVAAAAGGCILLKSELLEEMGGFAALRGELIDDCALARAVKDLGCRTWTGLSHSVRSLRKYDSLGAIWRLVSRTAFTQLRHSALLLAGCSAVMIISFWAPLWGLLSSSLPAKLISAATVVAMMVSYLPILAFYGLSKRWALTMPVVGTLYLAMTWSSAIRHWQGKGAQWKGRHYWRRFKSS